MSSHALFSCSIPKTDVEKPFYSLTHNLLDLATCWLPHVSSCSRGDYCHSRRNTLYCTYGQMVFIFLLFSKKLHIPVRQRKWRWNRISRWNIWRREYGNGQMAIKGCSQQWFIKIPTLSRHTLFDGLLCEDILRVPFYFFRVRNCEGITRNQRMINFPIVYQSRYIGLISLGKAWYRETSEGESGGMVGRGEG